MYGGAIGGPVNGKDESMDAHLHTNLGKFSISTSLEQRTICM